MEYVSLVNLLGYGMAAVLHAFGRCGYDEEAQQMWDALPNDSEYKEKIAKQFVDEFSQIAELAPMREEA